MLVCAEPDYGGRLDWPDFPIREWQIAGLSQQGANPVIGRQIRHLLAKAGLNADVSVLPSHWNAQQLHENFDNEWRWIEHDTRDNVDRETFDRVKKQAWAAIGEGLRLVYVPTFCAFARK